MPAQPATVPEHIADAYANSVRAHAALGRVRPRLSAAGPHDPRGALLRSVDGTTRMRLQYDDGRRAVENDISAGCH